MKEKRIIQRGQLCALQEQCHQEAALVSSNLNLLAQNGQGSSLFQAQALASLGLNPDGRNPYGLQGFKPSF